MLQLHLDYLEKRGYKVDYYRMNISDSNDKEVGGFLILGEKEVAYIYVNKFPIYFVDIGVLTKHNIEEISGDAYLPPSPLSMADSFDMLSKDNAKFTSWFNEVGKYLFLRARK